MRAIWAFIKQLYSGPFQAALVISFTLVAAITIGISTWVISNTITAYLARAMDERIEQDILTAEIFYQFQLDEMARSANQLALSRTVQNSFQGAREGNSDAIQDLAGKIQTALVDVMLNGNRVAVILDDEGRLVAGWLQSIDQTQVPLPAGSNWSVFPIFEDAINSGSQLSATEIIPALILEDAGLADQAHITLQDTPRAAPELFDPREETAGLGIVSAAPIRLDGQVVGAVVIFHLFNNDFSLVDAIQKTAQIDTATIFFGDLRVSTNVLTEAGERAVGTRVSQDVNQVVLQRGEEYVGTAFVVNENYITRYEPLRDHQGAIVGMLYVGARQADFLDFLNTFRNRISVVAGLTLLLTFLIEDALANQQTGGGGRFSSPGADHRGR
jgi:two-component system NtrC family sensor kinase